MYDEKKLSKDNGESLLNDSCESKSILNDTPCIKGEKNDIARLYTNIGRNGGTIFMITSYLIKDEDDVLSKLDRRDITSIESLRGFNYDEIVVELIDTRTKKGYACINGEINIPLIDLEGKSNKYFFDRNDVIKECKKLMEVEYNAVKKIQEVSARVESFIKRAIEKNSK
jgi:hypothetical protein